MKKLLLFTLIILFGVSQTYTPVYAKSLSPQVKIAISKYKAKNYVGCIQDLSYIVKRDPSNAAAFYYLGAAYMRIGNRDKAIEAFDKVITLNTIPPLTSYSIQAKNCMDNIMMCEYKKLAPEQINELIKDPQNYITQLKEKEKATTGIELDKERVEIDRLINGRYSNKIHPEAKKVIIDTMLMRQQQDINASGNLNQKSEAPTDEEIANAVKVLAKAGFNPINTTGNLPYNQVNNPNNEYAALSMMFGSNQNNNNNNYMNMLPFIMSENQTGNKQFSKEMIQAMMMSSMMPDFSFDSDKNNKY